MLQSDYSGLNVAAVCSTF